MPTSPPIEKLSRFHYRIHTEILIAAPVEKVWAILMDPEELARWSTSFVGMQGDLRPGGQVRVRFRLNGRELTPKHTLSAYSEGRSFAWADPIIPGLKDHHQYILEPLSEQQTRFVQKDALRGPLALVLGPRLSKWMLGLYTDFNTQLKATAERV